MEKAVKNKKTVTASGALSDFALRILSVIIAVIIWFALSITQFPTFTKTITNVPVVFSMAGTTAESKGLSALNYQDFTVDVEIEGMNYEIGTYSSNDLVATVNLDDVIKDGTYNLSIDVRSSHSTDQCRILSVNPQTVEVKFDLIDTITIPVSVSAPNVSAAEGYMLKGTPAQPVAIEVSGAENELGRIARLEAVYSDTLTLSEDMSVTSSTLLFYDENNNLLNSANYTVEDKLVNIKFVVYKKITSTFVPQYTDVPPNFDISSLPAVLSQDSIQIISPLLDADPEEELGLEPVSLYDIARGKVFKTAIESMLSTGELNQSGIEQVELSFELDDYITKTFTLPADSVFFINKPQDKAVTLDAEQIPGVQIIGPKSVIEKLKRGELKAVIDLSDVTANGSVSHEVVIYSELYNNIWNIGTHEVVITMSDKPEESSSAADMSRAESSSANASARARSESTSR